MGLPMDRFVNPVDENLICSICHGVFIIPVVTECGHTFCANCLKIWLNSKSDHFNHFTVSMTDRSRLNFTCPTCRTKLGVTNTQKYCSTTDITSNNNNNNGNINTYCLQDKPNINLLSIARPVLALKCFINSLQICCEYAKRGCTTIGSVEAIHFGNHRHTCAYAPVDCAGCGRTLNRIELAAHQLGCFGIQAELGEIREKRSKSSQEIQTTTTMDVGIQATICLIHNNEIHQSDCLTSKQSRISTVKLCNSSVQTYNEYLKKATCDSIVQTDFNYNESLIKVDQQNYHNNNRSLQLLNISLIKLVHALRVELETAQKELNMQ
ncbi:unnamed protein product, partial [Heterobilharzia americana]